MILFDICSLPKGVDINVWYSLYEKGLCIYDSKINGIKPEKIEADSVSFIDIGNMSIEERATLTNTINEISEEKHKEEEKVNNTVRENNRKLIEYLKNINNI